MTVWFLRSPRRGLILAAALCAAAAHGHAATWQRVAPNPTGSDLMSVDVLSPAEMWCVGAAGVVAHTVDGGATWQSTSVASAYNGGVFFLDAQHGWIVGNATFRTSDGGETWTHLNDNGTLEDVYFLDTLHGWACGNGGIVYRSTDGGTTWLGVGISGSTMRDVFFIDANTGWSVAIEGSIFKSTNGGVSWTKQYGKVTDYFCDVQFFDANEGWAIGGTSFFHTTDGGAHWQRMSVPSSTWAQGMHFSDRLHGCAVGDGGNIVATFDGGVTWNTMTPLNAHRLWDVKFIDAQNGFYVGEAGSIAQTTDGGVTWSNRQSGGWAFTHELTGVDATHLWAACEGGEVLYSHDGRFWDRSFPPGVDIYGSVNDVSFADTSTGWAVGENAFFGGSDFKIWKSRDGGRTWDIQFILYGGAFAFVAAADTQTVLVAGVIATPFVIKSSDGGTTWHPVTPPNVGSIDDMEFANATTGWIVGTYFWKTENAGDAWSRQFTPPSGGALTVSVVDAQVVWTAGALGRVWKTTDGGSTWSSLNTGSTATIFDIHGVDANTAWVAGLGGYVAVTHDGGATWTEEFVPFDPFTDLEAAYFLDADNGWVAGNTGIWMRTAPVTVGDRPVAGALDSQLLVSRNPAAPGERVTLRAPAGVHGTIEVTDVRGRIVRRVESRAGAAGWTWDGRDADGRVVSRGTYLATLTDGENRYTARIVRH